MACFLAKLLIHFEWRLANKLFRQVEAEQPKVTSSGLRDIG